MTSVDSHEPVADEAQGPDVEAADHVGHPDESSPPGTRADTGPTKTTASGRISWSRVLAYAVLPALAAVLVGVAGFLKWQDGSAHDADAAAAQSVQRAREATTALLSYQPDTADQQLSAAQDLLTGAFKDSYTQLIHGVVVPGAKQKQISAVASVPAAASVSASRRHAVVLVFIDQTVIVANGAPTATTSAVRVTLDNVGGRWLISGFDPI